MRAIMPIKVLPMANSGHSIGTPVSKKARRAVFSSRAAMIRCIPAIEINQIGKIARNQPTMRFQPTAPQSTSDAVSGFAVKCATMPSQPPTR